ncbi:MAG TPA: VWA domain-containing protein [Acidimicrobiales bacterium]|nr:VWA domain-containing protein [Acidimicrobiales bacterium]
MSAAAGDGVLAMLLALVDELRRAGVAISMVEVLDATSALGQLDLADRPVLRAGLGATLVKRPEDAPIFQLAFDHCFPVTRAEERPRSVGPEPAIGPNETLPGPVDASTDLLDALLAALRAEDSDALAALAVDAVDRHAGIGTVEGSERYFLYRVLRALDVANLLAAAMRAERARDPDATPLELRLRRDEHRRRIEELRRLIAEEIRRRLRQSRPGAEPTWLPHRLGDLDVLRASTTDLREMRAAVRPLARKLASRVAQRRRRRNRGRLDMRRTVRHSLTTGGVPMSPAFRWRKASKPNVVVLCDLSGSVAEFAQFTLALVHALDDELAGLRSFVFVDGVAEVTDLLDRADGVLEPRFLLTRAGVVTGDGHSDYGRVFERFWTVHGERVVTPATTLIVAGDARTNYRPAGVDPFRRLSERARRTYWLNPEPRAEWGIDDSSIADFAPWCTAVFEVRTLRQLADAVVEIV